MGLRGQDAILLDALPARVAEVVLRDLNVEVPAALGRLHVLAE